MRRKGNKFTEILLLIWIINQRWILDLKRWLLRTVRDYSPLFATVRHYSHYSRLFAVCYSLFGVFKTPNVPEFMSIIPNFSSIRQKIHILGSRPLFWLYWFMSIVKKIKLKNCVLFSTTIFSRPARHGGDRLFRKLSQNWFTKESAIP